MSVLSILKQIKVNAKVLLPILFLIGIFAKNVNSNSPTSSQFDDIDVNVEKLPYCDEKLIQDRASVSKRNIYVTTLDGRLTAIDIKEGSLQWSISTEPGELLSSSIHRLELTNNGKYVRMIPTLTGGIYKFDGDSLEAIPVTADDLLKSSFKFADDQVISGGKEVRTYGVNGRTGSVVYECAMDGCKRPNQSNVLSETSEDDQERDFNPELDDMIVINRHTQTVRAIEPRAGVERWNFSIGHHELKLESNANCKGQNGIGGELDQVILDMDLRVIVPDGIICGYSKTHPNTILWKHKFNAPVVSVHRMNVETNELYSVDLFQSAHWLWQGSEFSKPTVDSKISPSVYLGMYQQQLYIQEAAAPMGSIDQGQVQLEQNLLSDDSEFHKIPFKPFPASNTELLSLLEGSGGAAGSEDKTDVMKYDDQLNAQSLLYASQYADGKGFYFFTRRGFNHTMRCAKRTTNVNPEDFDNITFQNHGLLAATSSLWDYWKEISVIALTTAFVINVMLNNRRAHENGVVYVAVPMGKEAIEFEEEEQQKKQILENEIKEAQAKIRSASESNDPNKETPYVSRFLTDFDLVQCLGKGGFGVVFEVTNKLDSCRYAVKRILLPTKTESRDRVMREVRTLANCEHKNIVRYFHSWTEAPPKSWQEQKDKDLLNRDIFSTSITIDSPSPTEESKAIVMREKSKVNRSLYPGAPLLMNLQKNKDFSSTGNFGHSFTADDSDSYIQFKADTNNATETAGDNNIESDDDSDDESFEIEFRNETRTSVSEVPSESIQILSMNDGSSSDAPIKKSHRRQMSLDLPCVSSLLPKKSNTSLPSGSTKMYLYIQMQLCMKNSLKDWLRTTDLQTRHGRTFEIWSQIVEAVHYVHLKGLIHRDLKPSNIFFALDGQVKIGDFGLVTDMAEIPIDPLTSSSNSNSSANMEFDFTNISHKKHTQRVGTSLYMSPEQAKGLSYNYKVDIFSLGLILFELLNFFNTETERFKVLENIRKHVFPQDFIEKLKNEYELLKLMLSIKPEERPTTFGVFSRPPLNRPDDYREWNFELPTRRRESHSSHNSLSK